MNRHVIGVFEEDVPSSLREFDGAGDSACTVHGTDTDLDGRTIETGAFVTHVERDSELPTIDDGVATFVESERRELVGCRFLYDPTSGILTGDSSTIEKLFAELTAFGAPIARVTIDLDRWADRLDRDDNGHVWMRGWREGDEDDPTDVGVEFHTVDEMGRGDESNQLGWSYKRGKEWWRGYAAASGYVGLYQPSEETPADVAAWLRDDVAQYLRVPDPETESDGQQTLAAECEECGREPERDLHERGGRMLCVVCDDFESEQGVDA